MNPFNEDNLVEKTVIKLIKEIWGNSKCHINAYKDEDDLLPATKDNLSLDELKNSWMAKSNTPALFISAKEKENIDQLKDFLYEEVKRIHIKRYPYNNFLF